MSEPATDLGHLELAEHLRLRHECESALNAVEHALAEPSGKSSEVVAEAERRLAALRDDLIELLRHAHPAREGRSLHHALDKVNVCLSLIAGVEYPVGKGQRELLKDARHVLKDLLHRAALRVD